MDSLIGRALLTAAVSLVALFTLSPAQAAEPRMSSLREVPKDPLPLWPGTAPGDVGDIGEEKDTTKPDQDKPGKYVTRIGNVSKPTIQIFKPAKGKDTGAAVIVCPGGGYNILAMDLEGTEVCKWLNSIGVTAVLLKYRVPRRKEIPFYAAPLQDAQRAMGLVRSHAHDWEIDPHRIGILGFSAGGNLSAMVSNNFASRSYPNVDDADKENCRPDFTLLIYPAYLSASDGATTLSPQIPVTDTTPAAFIVMTVDDPVHMENAIAYTLALKNAKVPVELHLYPKGGHGYGLRPSENSVTNWPARAAEWIKTSGFLSPTK